MLVQSCEQSLEKAHQEYDKYMKDYLTKVELDYLKVLNKEIKDINNQKMEALYEAKYI